MKTQYDSGDIPDERNELDVAKAIVKQWDKYDKFRIPDAERKGEPDDVKVARALLRINHEYGCEVRDPCGTIWEHAAKVEADNKRLQAHCDKLVALAADVLKASHHGDQYLIACLNGDDIRKARLRSAIFAVGDYLREC
jgi:hypothetical protein